MHEIQFGKEEGGFGSVVVLVLNWNGRSLLQTCLPPLLDQTYANYRVVLVDNASTDDSVSWVQTNYPQVHIIQNAENLGFSRGMNAGLRQISADLVVLLNNDVLVQPNWLVELIRPFHQDPTIGIVGAKLLFPDGTIQHLGAELTYPLAHSHHFHYQEPDHNQITHLHDVPYVTGASLAVRREVLAKIGLLDEAFHPFYYEEVDFCHRATEAGYRVVVAPQAIATHDESATMAKVSGLKLQAFYQNRLRYVLKHYTIDQFLHDFVPAEAAYLAETPTPSQRDQLRLAYFVTAVPQPPIPANATNEERTAVQNALLHLRHIAIQTQATAAPPPLTEFTFPTSSSLLGGLVGWLRRAWSSIAAKWLVRNLLQQQNQQNQHLLRQIEQLHSQAAIQAQETDKLLANLNLLRERLDQLENEARQRP